MRPTETFLVRVPGGGGVPEHVHTDMEQTFGFVSGVRETTLSRGGEQARRFGCVPGDVVFVPAGWRHTVLAQSVAGFQSPISVKVPCEESDLDILVVVEPGDGQCRCFKRSSWLWAQ
jgi:quercetin dioxygenase-like cupin family protein